MNKNIPIKLRLAKKSIIWFRLLMIVLAATSLFPVWFAISDGYFVTRGGIRQDSDSPSMIFYSLKYFIIAGFCMWLATGGVREKEKNEKQ